MFLSYLQCYTKRGICSLFGCRGFLSHSYPS
ncbi:MAG: hypothetical protein DCC43_03505 [Candidatus Brocadia sp.]|nr:hypothetical protein [Candidatus Brocadia sp. AMX3]MDG5996102.1 hypothetical protein [Candidatus Brocadia sp.]RIK02358.1 MAG: hypothetical protein DCC43_03505 [Candidatus Brocadia sp.]